MQVPQISAISPLGGPDAGGGAVFVHGSGFVDLGGVAVRLGTEPSASWLVTHLLNASTLLAFAANVSNASAVYGVPLVYEGGGYEYAGQGPAARRGVSVSVTLNGARREIDLIHGTPNYTYYPAAGLRVSGILPQVCRQWPCPSVCICACCACRACTACVIHMACTYLPSFPVAGRALCGRHGHHCLWHWLR